MECRSRTGPDASTLTYFSSSCTHFTTSLTTLSARDAPFPSPRPGIGMRSQATLAWLTLPPDTFM
eukprot:8913629-Pyramimonas_sp.AAC.1